MITKNDVILLLTDLQNKGIDVSNELNETLKLNSISLNALRLIYDNRNVDIINFYNKLRKSYNDKRSKLYISIMKSDENKLNDPKKVLTTLSALLNQIFQYKAEDQVLFYKHSRCSEIAKVLDAYCNSYNLEAAFQLLALIKADIVALEYVTGKRIF